jgi:hypothetical protein
MSVSYRTPVSSSGRTATHRSRRISTEAWPARHAAASRLPRTASEPYDRQAS